MALINPYKEKGMLPYDSEMFFGRHRELRSLEEMLSGASPQCVSTQQLCDIAQRLCNVARQLCNIARLLCNVTRQLCDAARGFCNITQLLSNVKLHRFASSAA